MPYVERNGGNRVVEKFAVPQYVGQEFLPEGHIDLIFVPTAEEITEKEESTLSARLLDRQLRTIFEVCFNLELRARVLEGKAPITKQAYQDVWLAVFKATGQS